MENSTVQYNTIQTFRQKTYRCPSVRKILQKDRSFLPYKMVALQELSDRSVENSSTVAELLIRIMSDDVIKLMTHAAHFHLFGCVNTQNVSYWAE